MFSKQKTVMNFNKTYVIIVVFYFSIQPNSVLIEAKGAKEEQELVAFLNKNIPQKIAPLDMVNKTLTLGIEVTHLMSVSDADSLMAIRVRFDYEYTVQSASWDPLQFGNVTRINVGKDQQFWEPRFGKYSKFVPRQNLTCNKITQAH